MKWYWWLIGVVVLWILWNRFAKSKDVVASLKTGGMDFTKGIN